MAINFHWDTATWNTGRLNFVHGPWMNMKFQIKEFQDHAKKIVDNVQNGMYVAFVHALIFMEARIKEKIRINFRHSNSGVGVNAVGRLSSDWSRVITMGTNEVEGVVGTRVKYARIHEFGGVIKPRTKQALTIPFPGRAVGSLPPAYVLKNDPTRESFISKGVIFAKEKHQKGSKKGQWKTSIPKIVKQRHGDLNIYPMYVLKKSVTIPARSYVGYVVNNFGPGVQKALGNAIKVSMRT